MGHLELSAKYLGISIVILFPFAFLFLFSLVAVLATERWALWVLGKGSVIDLCPQASLIFIVEFCQVVQTSLELLK